MTRRALAREIFVVTTLTTLTGCFPVPIPQGEVPGSRQNVGDKVPEFIVAGKTTRTDVLLRLGEPDIGSDARPSWLFDDKRFVYGRITSEGGVGLVFPIGTGAAVGYAPVLYRRLVVTFDEAGVVNSAGLDRFRCPDSFPAEAEAKVIGRCTKLP